ncbi:hypothetical protein JHN53_17260 [Streptomyces sp. MBT58]|uniref:hypothetical protein n=1 Tax=Streptomyces sp. MBT58 TaxID=1488389 RepID=UPI0019115C44|nr:hypothetical protein [Streptomyces sp. MBT58]MBK5993360.1 hypothetical protein [Streptomyces sp. MBT58]
MNIRKELDQPTADPTPDPPEGRAWWPARTGVLAVLGVITLGVAILSVGVSYQILEPKFGNWAVPVVGALDALWVVFQLTEILAGNQRRRAQRVQWAGFALTLINAAIPTADLVMSRSADGIDLAVVITPIAILATKAAWWIALPALGRPVSAPTRQTITARRQTVADQLEKMAADTADRIELLRVATELETDLAEAETAYRKQALKTRQTMVEELHKQAEATEKTVTAKALPASVTAIRLPQLEGWEPTTPALTAAPDRATSGAPALDPAHPGNGDDAQVNGEPGASGEDDDAPGADVVMHATLANMAAATGVETPRRGVTLTDAQLELVLSYLRHNEDPPLDSCRKADRIFRAAGFRASQHRVRETWRDLLTREGVENHDDQDAEDPEDSTV